MLLAVKVAAAAVTPVGGGLAFVGAKAPFACAPPFNLQSIGRCTVHAMWCLHQWKSLVLILLVNGSPALGGTFFHASSFFWRYLLVPSPVFLVPACLTFLDNANFPFSCIILIFMATISCSTAWDFMKVPFVFMSVYRC